MAAFFASPGLMSRPVSLTIAYPAIFTCLSQEEIDIMFATSQRKGALRMATRELNESETNTLLAALRLWQHELYRRGLPEWSDEYFRDREPLTVDQIDELCERLNCAEK